MHNICCLKSKFSSYKMSPLGQNKSESTDHGISYIVFLIRGYRCNANEFCKFLLLAKLKFFRLQIQTIDFYTHLSVKSSKLTMNELTSCDIPGDKSLSNLTELLSVACISMKSLVAIITSFLGS